MTRQQAFVISRQLIREGRYYSTKRGLMCMEFIGFKIGQLRIELNPFGGLCLMRTGHRHKSRVFYRFDTSQREYGHIFWTIDKKRKGEDINLVRVNSL